MRRQQFIFTWIITLGIMLKFSWTRFLEKIGFEMKLFGATTVELYLLMNFQESTTIFIDILSQISSGFLIHSIVLTMN